MSRRLYYLIFALISGVFMLVGGYVTLVESPRVNHEARHIEGLPDVLPTRRALDMPPVEIALMGILTNNIPSDNYEYGLVDLNLVAYEVHEWRVRTTSDGGVTGSWVLKRRWWGRPLSMRVDDSFVSISVSTTATWGGALHEILVRDGTGQRSAAYNGTELHDGAVRVRGFRNGDQITVIGASRGNGVIPEQIYAGSRAELVDDLRVDAQFLRWFGLCFGGAGALLGVVTLVVFVRRH